MDRDQRFLLPVDMREWLPDDHVVWFLIDAVAQMDTTACHAGARLGGRGRRGFDPDMLLTLFVYAMSEGITSSRKIEALCRTDVAFRVICAQDVPDHTVLARFRQRHEAALTDLLEESLVLAARLGMVRLGVVALDGTKIAANASARANRTEETLRRDAQQYVDGLESTDSREDALFGVDGSGDEPPQALRDRTHRGRRIQAAVDQIEQRRAKRDAAEAARVQKKRVRQERPAARPKRSSEERLRRSEDRLASLRARQQARYDAYRARVTAEGVRGRRVLPPHEVVKIAQAEASVQRLRARRDAEAAKAEAARHAAQKAEQAKLLTAGQEAAAAWRAKLRTNVTDPDSRTLRTRSGWCQGMNCQLSISEDEFIMSARATQDYTDVLQYQPTVAATVAMAGRVGERTGRRDLQIGLVLADAGYDSNANLAAPGPDRLIPHSKKYRLEAEAAREPAVGPPPPGASAREAMNHRLRTEEGVRAYRRRSPMIESANAWIKDRRGLRRFARRGLAATNAELSLAAAVTNLLKIRSKILTGPVLQAL